MEEYCLIELYKKNRRYLVILGGILVNLTIGTVYTFGKIIWLRYLVSNHKNDFFYPIVCLLWMSFTTFVKKKVSSVIAKNNLTYRLFGFIESQTSHSSLGLYLFQFFMEVQEFHLIVQFPKIFWFLIVIWSWVGIINYLNLHIMSIRKPKESHFIMLYLKLNFSFFRCFHWHPITNEYGVDYDIR